MLKLRRSFVWPIDGWLRAGLRLWFFDLGWHIQLTGIHRLLFPDALKDLETEAAKSVSR